MHFVRLKQDMEDLSLIPLPTFDTNVQGTEYAKVPRQFRINFKQYRLQIFT